MDGSIQYQMIALGATLLSPTLLVVTGHPEIGIAALVGVLVASVLLAWMQLRTAQQRHQSVLRYAQDTTNMGGDPTGVINAIQGRQLHGAPPELPPRRYDLRGYQQIHAPHLWHHRSTRT